MAFDPLLARCAQAGECAPLGSSTGRTEPVQKQARIPRAAVSTAQTDNLASARIVLSQSILHPGSVRPISKNLAHQEQPVPRLELLRMHIAG